MRWNVTVCREQLQLSARDDKCDAPHRNCLQNNSFCDTSMNMKVVYWASVWTTKLAWSSLLECHLRNRKVHGYPAKVRSEFSGFVSLQVKQQSELRWSRQTCDTSTLSWKCDRFFFFFSANEVIPIPNPVGDLFVFSDSMCSDEESNLYFEGVTWSVSDCIKCECSLGLISCTKTMTFLTSTIVHIEHCNQPNCSVVAFLNSHKRYCQGKHMLVNLEIPCGRLQIQTPTGSTLGALKYLRREYCGFFFFLTSANDLQHFISSDLTTTANSSNLKIIILWNRAKYSAAMHWNWKG